MNRLDRHIDRMLAKLGIELEDASAEAMANLEEDVIDFRKNIKSKALKLADVRLSEK